MNLIEILLLAVALSIDACVVSFSYGLVIEKYKRINSLLLAISTGFFQFLMPILGFYFASFLQQYLQKYAKFIIFTIFAYLGFKFIKDALTPNNTRPVCLNIKCLLLISIATSIDAFSAGISLLLSGNNILFPAIIIGIITFLNALFGYWSGFLLKKCPTTILEISAGTILIGLGIKALF